MQNGISFESADLYKIDSSIENVSFLKRGGQKEVFLCDVNGKKYVIKVVLIEQKNGNNITVDDESLKRVLREIAILNTSASNYLPKVGCINPDIYEKGDYKYYYYSEEYIQGDNLHDFLGKNTLDFKLLIKLTEDIVFAIKDLWNMYSAIHRDIKPENIIFNKQTDDFVLIDAGMALLLSEVSITPTGYVVGTLPYMSPEQIGGRKRSLDFRSDFYSLGIVLYESITGKHPYLEPYMKDSDLINKILYYSPPKLTSMNLSFPIEFLKIVDLLISKRPHLRFNSCDTILEKLAKVGHN